MSAHRFLSAMIPSCGLAGLLLTGLACKTPAQRARDDSTRSRLFANVHLLDDPSLDRQRSTLLRDSSSFRYSLLRSASSLTPRLGTDVHRLNIALVPPALRLTHNAALPYSLNDGAMWAGRGLNVDVIGGARAERGRVRLFLLPEWTSSANDDFSFTVPAIFPPRLPWRSPWSSPFHMQAQSIDLPIRFGKHRIDRLDWGQSALVVEARRAELGISTENNWWGPGAQNALLLSNNAGGFPHLFVRSASPIRTRLGTIEARWLSGGLSESDYFDNDPDNDFRRISLLGVTLAPSAAPGLTIGAARSVFGPAKNAAAVLPGFFQVFRDVGQPDAVAITDTTRRSGPDQLFSLFARWVFPSQGFEAYGEWGRSEFPVSLRDFLVQPNNTQAFVMGLQWLGETIRWTGGRIQVQAEATFVQQSTNYRFRPMGSWYTSTSTLQGYTQRGQVLGAAIGPGSSQQWLAFDHVRPAWSVGVYANRIRWLEDARSQALKNPTPGNGWCEHDVSMMGGARSTLSTGLGTIAADYSTGWRLNVFFQHDINSCPFNQGVDARERSLTIRMTPNALRW